MFFRKYLVPISITRITNCSTFLLTSELTKFYNMAKSRVSVSDDKARKIHLKRRWTSDNLLSLFERDVNQDKWQVLALEIPKHQDCQDHDNCKKAWKLKEHLLGYFQVSSDQLKEITDDWHSAVIVLG